ncbi:MAG: helix-turn-helix domain-containing protein [Terriglobales bacterium]
MDWFEDPANLRDVRKQLGIGQRELAGISGVTASWIAAVETGRIALVGPKAQQLWDSLERTFKARVAEHKLSPMAAARIRSRANQLLAMTDDQERLDTTERLIDAQTELIQLYSTVIEKKDEDIARLTQQVSDLRGLYDAETQAALAYDKARELRAKVTGHEERD